MSRSAQNLADVPVLTFFPPPPSGSDATVCTTRCHTLAIHFAIRLPYTRFRAPEARQ